MLESPIITWLCITLAWLLVHFLLYTIFLRPLRLFSRERVIFLYQLLSFLIMPGVLVCFGPRPDHLFATLTTAVGLHGIYSLSFLELWSLAEGSYSLRILDHIERAGVMQLDADVSEFEQFGSSKKSGRLEGLKGLRLLRSEDDRYVLSPAGRLAAVGLRLLVWLVNINKGTA
jgi:hypothetical protein